MRSRITGIGFHVPPRVVTNHDLAKVMDTSDEWIIERTGIRERHFVEPGTGTTDLALEASQHALADAGRDKQDLDFILFATITRDYCFPGCAPLLQHALGLPTIGAMEIHNACSGFVYAVAMADALVRAGERRCILAVGSEVQSTGLDLTTRGRDMAVLFGDGAGAVVIEPSADERGILASVLRSEGAHARELWAEAPSSKEQGRITPEMIADGRHFPHMNGRQVFKHATTLRPWHDSRRLEASVTRPPTRLLEL